MRKLIFLVIISVSLTGCFEYQKVSDVFPQHFPANKVRLPHEDLPEEIYNSLPGDFKLAQVVGFLSTDVFTDASIAYHKKGERYKKRKFKESRSLKNRIKELEADYKIFIPIQFPHVLCYYPKNINLIDAFENEASLDIWVRLNEISNNDSTIAVLSSELYSLHDTINFKLDFKASLEKLKADKLEEEKNWIQINKNIDAAILDIDSKLKAAGLSPLVGTFYENFNPTVLNVFTKNDPFEDTHKKYQVSIKDKPYNTPSTKVNGYDMLNIKMVDALDKLNSTLFDPRNSLGNDKGFSEDEIKTLEEWVKHPNNKLQIASAARSPQHQAAVANPNKAGAISSKHMMGVAVDINISGKSYDPTNNKPAYDLFRKVAANCGLFFPLPNKPSEQGHAVLAEYQNPSAANTELYCRELANLLDGYNKGILKELEQQEKNKGEKERERQKFENQINDLNDKISEKLAEVKEINSRIDELKKAYGGKSDVLQKKSNELCSKLAAKERQNNREINRSIGNHDGNGGQSSGGSLNGSGNSGGGRGNSGGGYGGGGGVAGGRIPFN